MSAVPKRYNSRHGKVTRCQFMLKGYVNSCKDQMPIHFFLEKVPQEHKKTSFITVIVFYGRSDFLKVLIMLSYLLYHVFDFALFA